MNFKYNYSKIVKRRQNGIDFNLILNRESFSEIEEIFKCNICSQIMINPHDCEICGNAFCYDCIINLFENGKICPGGCKEKRIKQISSVIKAQLNCLNLKCENNDCKQIFQYNDYVSHLKECIYSNVICPNQGCEKQIKIEFLEDHINNECECTCIHCENCEFDFKRIGYQNHLETCKLIYDNYNKRYNLKGNEKEDFMLINSSKFMNTIVLNLTRVLQTFDGRFEIISRDIDSIKEKLEEKPLELINKNQFPIKNERIKEINFSIEKNSFTESVPSLEIMKSKNNNLKKSIPTKINEKISKDLAEFEHLENFFATKKPSKPDKINSSNENKNNYKDSNILNVNNPSLKIKTLTGMNYDIINNVEKKSNTNDSIELSIKENLFSSLNDKIDKLFEMMQIILLTTSSNSTNANASHSTLNPSESSKPFSSHKNKKESFSKNPTHKSNTLSNTHLIAHQKDKKESKTINKIEKTVKADKPSINVFNQTTTNNNNLQSSFSFSKQHNSSTSSLMSSRSKIEFRKSIVSKEKSPRAKEVKSFPELLNESSLNPEILKLMNKILEKINNMENSFNFDDLNNKLQHIGTQLRESITQAFLEIIKLNMNQNKNEEETNQVNDNNNKLMSENKQLSIELNKKILEKLNQIQKENFDSYSNMLISNEENFININNINNNSSRNLLNEIIYVKSLIENMKKIKEERLIENENKIIEKAKLKHEKISLNDLKGITNLLESNFNCQSDLLIKCFKSSETGLENIKNCFYNEFLISISENIEKIICVRFELVWCLTCKRLDSKSTNKYCEICNSNFCKYCGVYCIKCNKITCEKCMFCPMCEESYCKKCRKVCISCSLTKENPDSVCFKCLKLCKLCKGENCQDCLKSCSDCNTNYCVKCGKICMICSKTMCKKCDTSYDYVTCNCCKMNICSTCIKTCKNCINQACSNCLIICQKCKKEICVSCSTICSSCNGAYDVVCGKNNMQTKCFKCDNNFCNFCASSNSLICKNCNNNYCKKCIKNCSKCKNLVCSNCILSCDQCGGPNCGKCLEKCVCNKIVFCEDCLFDTSPISPHDCIKWLNGSHTFSGIKSRSILPLPNNFEVKLYIEKLSSDIYIGLTDKKNFEENSLVFLDQIWTLKVKEGKKYSRTGAHESFLNYGAKEYDSIYVSFNSGKLNFKINSDESLTAFNLDQTKEYYLYIENDDHNTECKVSIIYIRKQI